MFTPAVANGRGMPPASVRNDYGKGHILTANQTIQGGMIDKIRSVSAILAAYGVTSVALDHSDLGRGPLSGSSPHFPYPNDPALRRAPRPRANAASERQPELVHAHRVVFLHIDVALAVADLRDLAPDLAGWMPGRVHIHIAGAVLTGPQQLFELARRDALLFRPNDVVCYDRASDLAVTRWARLRSHRCVVKIAAQEHADPAVGGATAEVDVSLRHLALEAKVFQAVANGIRSDLSKEAPLPGRRDCGHLRIPADASDGNARTGIVDVLRYYRGGDGDRW
jgi:hypothetical protein